MYTFPANRTRDGTDPIALIADLRDRKDSGQTAGDKDFVSGRQILFREVSGPHRTLFQNPRTDDAFQKAAVRARGVQGFPTYEKKVPRRRFGQFVPVVQEQCVKKPGTHGFFSCQKVVEVVEGLDPHQGTGRVPTDAGPAQRTPGRVVRRDIRKRSGHQKNVVARGDDLQCAVPDVVLRRGVLNVHGVHAPFKTQRFQSPVHAIDVLREKQRLCGDAQRLEYAAPELKAVVRNQFDASVLGAVPYLHARSPLQCSGPCPASPGIPPPGPNPM